MSLKQWAANGWLRGEPTSPHEIKNLLAIAERDLRDAARDISARLAIRHRLQCSLVVGRLIKGNGIIL